MKSANGKAANADSSGSVRMIWIGTAGFILRYRGTTLLLDPHLTRPHAQGRAPVTPSEAASARAVLVTHGHFDHAMDLPYLAAVSPAEVFAPERVCRLLAGFGIDSARLLPNERTVTRKVGDIQVDVLPSRHIRYDGPLIALTLLNSIRSGVFKEALGLGLSWPLGSNSDFYLRCGDVSVFHAGSLGADPRHRQGLRPDVALLPCAGRSDMVGPLARLCEAMEPGKVVLHHHDVFWPGFVLPQPAGMVAEKLEQRIPGLAVEVARLGTAVELRG